MTLLFPVFYRRQTLTEALYSFKGQGYRGRLHGLFLAKESAVEQVYGQEVHFGEVLGKFSEVTITLNKGNLKKVTNDKDIVAVFKKITKLAGEKKGFGYNPFESLLFCCENCFDDCYYHEGGKDYRRCQECACDYCPKCINSHNYCSATSE